MYGVHGHVSNFSKMNDTPFDDYCHFRESTRPSDINQLETGGVNSESYSPSANPLLDVFDLIFRQGIQTVHDVIDERVSNGNVVFELLSRIYCLKVCTQAVLHFP